MARSASGAFIRSNRRLDQVGERRRAEEGIVLVVLGRDGEGGGVVAEPELEHRQGVLHEPEHPAVADSCRVRRDHRRFGSRPLVAGPGERDQPSDVGRSPDRLHELRPLGEVDPSHRQRSVEELGHSEEHQADRQEDERPVVAGGLLEAPGQAVPRLVITQRARGPAADRQPPQHLVGVGRVRLERVDRRAATGARQRRGPR